MTEKKLSRDNINEIMNTILNPEEKDKTITIPIKDLIWAMIYYTYELLEIEEQIPTNSAGDIILNTKNHSLLVNKECRAARTDELGRLISQYSDFDTQRIHKETGRIIMGYTK